MDLSDMPTDIIPIIIKHFLTFDNKFKFKKVQEKPRQ